MAANVHLVLGALVSRPLQNNPPRDLKAAKYEIQKPSTCRATLFRCKFWSMFRVVHLS